MTLSDSGDQASSTTQTKQPAVTDATPAVSVTPTTEAETKVQDIIAPDGLHVVHFWAPWCTNSTVELRNGWASLVRDNPNVTFTFVTVWADGKTGTALLDEVGLPDRVTTVAQPDLGPSDNEDNRRRSFLTHPVTWIPSTWIFHNNGELAFAMNYGEMDMSTIQSLIDATRTDW
ncbi:MAG: thioredoxin [Bacteroidetes bacterium SW_9_63_38]|nr:MAG: thioredoxin [Bacteroidetes bacterium SW_9_63_38]